MSAFFTINTLEISVDFKVLNKQWVVFLARYWHCFV